MIFWCIKKVRRKIIHFNKATYLEITQLCSKNNSERKGKFRIAYLEKITSSVFIKAADEWQRKIPLITDAWAVFNFKQNTTQTTQTIIPEEHNNTTRQWWILKPPTHVKRQEDYRHTLILFQLLASSVTDYKVDANWKTLCLLRIVNHSLDVFF